LDGVAYIVGIALKSALFAVAVGAVFMFVRTFLFLFTGRIRKLGIEILVSIGIMAYLTYHAQNHLWLNMSVVLIALAFLYDIWKLADFQGLKVPDNWMEILTKEDD
jgi:hypothetical protein